MKRSNATFSKKPKKYVSKKPKSLMDTIAKKYSTSKQETKTVDSLNNSSQITTVPQYYILNAPLTGTNFWNRIGNKISMKSLRIRYQVRELDDNEGVLGSCFLRFIVVYDRQNNELPSSFGDIFTMVQTNGTVSSDPLSQTNLNNSERYLIIHDNIIPIWSNRNNSSASTPTQINYSMIDGTPKMYFDKYIKLKGLETKFSASTGADTDITTGALYFLVLSDIASGGANNSPFWIKWNARLRFYDN